MTSPHPPFWHLVNNRDSKRAYRTRESANSTCASSPPPISCGPVIPPISKRRSSPKLKMPVVVMGIGIQRKEGLKEQLPAGTLKFLEVLRNKESFFLTRGYFTAEFLREQGMKFVKPTGCPSLYFSPNDMKRSLSALANPGLSEAQKNSLRRLSRQRCRYDRRCPRASQARQRRKLCRPGRSGCLQPLSDRRRQRHRL